MVATDERALLKGYLHKTSNSLCGIKGYASLLADPHRIDEDPGRWARKILDEIARLEDVFRSVAGLTRDRSHPDIGVPFVATVRDVAVAEAACHPELSVRFGPIPDGEILLPAADLRLVVQEILRNGAESKTKRDDEVAVVIDGSVRSNGRVSLTITDDGPGIDMAVLARCTEPFFTTKVDHLGVGLTRVATLMEMYGLSWGLRPGCNGGTVVELELAEADA